MKKTASILFWTITMLLFASCVKDGDPTCYNVKLVYRYYQPGEGDLLLQHVKSAYHYLFKDHVFVEAFEADSPEMLKEVRLTLDPGNYTLVTWGNLGEQGEITPPTANQTHIDEMLLAVNCHLADDVHANTDYLFFARRDFQVQKNKAVFHWVDYSHVHNILEVTVRWREKSPLVQGHEYLMGLSGICGEYGFRQQYGIPVFSGEDSLDESTETCCVHTMPDFTSSTLVDHGLLATPNESYELKGSFVTLRYMNDQIPLFYLYDGEQTIIDGLELARIFSSFGWELTNNTKQEFKILIEIDADGRIYVSSVKVGDWEDGGYISGSF